MDTIFDYADYKVYLKDVISRKRNNGRGMRSALSKAACCQGAYVSRVLNENAHFSLEQAEKISAFLGHTEEEADFFILLVQRARSGTAALQKYFLKKINDILKRQFDLKERFKVRMDLALENQAIYYSAWYYSAIHILLSIPQFQTKDAIADHLNLPVSKVGETIEFLVRAGLAKKEGDRFKITKTRIHVGSDSAFLNRHHLNWRMQAVQSMERLDRSRDEQLHYSSVVSVSETDIHKMKSKLVRTIEEVNDIVKSSKEESAQCLAIDLFRV